MARDLRFEVENHLLDCNLCNHAVDGYMNHYDDLGLASSEKNTIMRWIPIAAAAVLLLFGGLAIYKYTFVNRADTIFAHFYQKPSWDFQNRSNSEQTAYEDAINNYNLGLYQAALPTFDSLLVHKDEDNQLRLYKGIAHIETNQFKLAEEELTTVRINSDLYFEEATWYLALLKIKAEKNQEANAYLDELIEMENGFFYQRAIEMKNRLQK